MSDIDRDPALSIAGDADEDPGWPIGFMAFVGLAGLYLVWRFVQVVLRLVEWLF